MGPSGAPYRTCVSVLYLKLITDVIVPVPVAGLNPASPGPPLDPAVMSQARPLSSVSR